MRLRTAEFCEPCIVRGTAGEVVTCLGRWKTVLCDMVLAAPLLLLLLRCLGAVFVSLVWQTKSIWGLKKGEDVFFCTLVVPSP